MLAVTHTVGPPPAIPLPPPAHPPPRPPRPPQPPQAPAKARPAAASRVQQDTGICGFFARERQRQAAQTAGGGSDACDDQGEADHKVSSGDGGDQVRGAVAGCRIGECVLPLTCRCTPRVRACVGAGGEYSTSDARL